jgi:hypothetical protein
VLNRVARSWQRHSTLLFHRARLLRTQEVFLLTPYQLAKHWQPLILSYAVLGQHVAVLHTVTLYSNWWKAGIVYTLLALFGAFGFAGASVTLPGRCAAAFTSAPYMTHATRTRPSVERNKTRRDNPPLTAVRWPSRPQNLACRR